MAHVKSTPAPPAEAEDAGAQVEEGETSETMEGVASIALLPSGAISGHFIRLPDSICYGLHGTRIYLSVYSPLAIVNHACLISTHEHCIVGSNHLSLESFVFSQEDHFFSRHK